MASQQLPQKRFLDTLRKNVLGDEKPATLVIGDIALWKAQGRNVPEVDDIDYLEFDALSEQALQTHQPDVVLSPLVTDVFDAFQVITLLSKVQFKGRYRAIAPTLPDIEMIRAEVQTQAREIDFDIVMMPPKLVSVT